MKKRILIALSFALLLIAGLSVSAFAANAIDFNRTVSLNVEVGTQGADVNLYRVGDIDNKGNGYLLNNFEKYAVELDKESGDSMAAARALELFLIRDDILPTVTDTADSNGHAYFDDLKTGVYLVSSKPIKGNDGIKMFAPMLISLPTLIDGEWKYDCGTTMKHETRSEQTYCKVKKIWSGEGAEAEPVTVQLLKDGVVYDEYVLSDENGWSYTWSELEGGYWWSVIEKDVPGGYKLSLTAEGFIYTLENKFVEEEPDQPGDEPEIPGDEPEVPGDGSEMPDDGNKLPQTGQLWWPVSILFAMGIALILGGICIMRIGKNINKGTINE